MDVPPNTTELVSTQVYYVSSDFTNLRYVATATYIDKVMGIEAPGQTSATASAPVESGTQTNKTATITYVESISGEGFSFSVDTDDGASGSFQESALSV